jgi:Ribulose-phosphate 3 epimerase family
MIELAPSILSADFARLGEEAQAAVEGGATVLHVDIMDGHFVPNLTIGPPVVASLRHVVTVPLDCHLMIERPDDFIPAFAEAGVDWISAHQEACVHLDRTLHLIASHGCKPGVVMAARVHRGSPNRRPTLPLCTISDGNLAELRCCRVWQFLTNPVDQSGRADLQRSGDLNDVIKRDVPLPAFNLGDVVAMNISTIRQFLLADLPLFPQCSDSLPKLNEDIPHPHMVGYMLTIGL